jgi:hypothetical protein
MHVGFNQNFVELNTSFVLANYCYKSRKQLVVVLIGAHIVLYRSYTGNTYVTYYYNGAPQKERACFRLSRK